MKSLLADFRLAMRNLLRNRWRTSVAVLTVAFGIIAFLLAGGFIAWIFEQMREGAIHSQLGHIQIVRPGYYEKGIADPYAFLLPEQSGGVLKHCRAVVLPDMEKGDDEKTA